MTAWRWRGWLLKDPARIQRLASLQARAGFAACLNCVGANAGWW
jgi:hypothetical protein